MELWPQAAASDGFKKLKLSLACMGRNLAGAERYYDLTWYKKASAGL